MIKLIGGLALMAIGIVVGFYVGLWVCFAGGIISIIRGFQFVPVNGSEIAFGIVKMLCASFCGWFSAVVFMIPGYLLFASYSTYKPRKKK